MTGSSRVGRSIVERASRYLKPCLLKLGGKAPLVVLTGGDSPGKVAIMAPVVLNRVTTDIRIYGEESFGPIVAIIRVKDTEHAIEIPHDTEYGLSAAVSGQHKRSALAVAGRIESGICHINGPTIADEVQMPFGGVNGSRYGHSGGGDRPVRAAESDHD